MVQIEGAACLHHIAVERDLVSALHGSEEVGVKRVEPASCRGVTAGRTDGEGEPHTAEDDRPVPVGCPSHPRVSPPFVPQQIEELVDRNLLLLDPIDHISARGTLAVASR
jgi:hypothetical protein